MTIPEPVDGADQIDPQWWESLLDEKTSEFELPEDMAPRFEARLKQDDLGELERQVLESLAVASSAMLEADSSLEPFRAMIEWHGQRSPLPSDLDADQLALLGQVAPMIKSHSLRARVADVAWSYGDIRAADLLNLAIEAYRTSPLHRDHWARITEQSWRRALQLAKRLGRRRGEVIQPMCDAMRDLILNAEMDDRFFVIGVSKLLDANMKFPVEVGGNLAAHLVQLAADALPSNPRLSRHFERQAAAWFARCDDPDSSNDCVARIAETYVAAAADARMATDESGALAAAMEIENAIATIRGLPRTYRQEHGLDSRLVELRTRLDDMREATLEAMISIEGDPIDLSEYVAHAQARVSGKEPFDALVAFANIAPVIDKDEAQAEVRSQMTGSLAALFPRATFSSDGRKVAATGGIDDANYVWSEVVRNFGIRVNLTTAGLILPAGERLLVEHRYRLEFVTQLCVESPTVPPGHEHLWARGLWHGFNDDIPSAVSVLVPQLEQAVRFRMKLLGLNTMVIDPVTGVETEKGLGSLLVQEGVEEHFGVGLTTELRALLVEQGGANLRNDVAHGLFADGASWSYAAVYCWWLLLRIVVTPVWHLRQSSEPVAEDPSDSA
jgi:hypothetical protein